MIANPVIYRISYSMDVEGVRPLPQFYFYVEARSEQQALKKLNHYAETQDINYRSVAVGYTLTAEDLPSELYSEHLAVGETRSLAQGIAIDRSCSLSTSYPPLTA